MGKNEIRLRRQRLTARGADRYRNFGVVMQRHEQEVRLRKIMRVFTLFAIILILIILIIMVVRWENRTIKKTADNVWKRSVSVRG
jgi:hypothetical protein